ncbi:MAG: type III secretion protein [Mailhella sp.]|nr:type III secretion protein [Mailhella sp.]
MESYPLDSLLSVRHFREESAKREVRYAELAVREAEEEVLSRRKALEDFHAWRLEEEERRYDAIMNKPMSIRQIDIFKAGLAKLAAEEALKEEDIRKAEQKVEEAKKALDTARENAKKAMKNTAKITAHKDIWAEEAKKEAEHMADLELEEFRPISRHGAEAEGEDA